MKIEENVLLGPHTSYRVGGPARYWAAPRCARDAGEVLAFTRERNLPLFILGRGSNVLISDTGFPGMVLSTENMTQVSCTEGVISVGAGLLLNDLVKNAVSAGLAGLENLSGIPGSVGGGIVMNAGAFGAAISDTLSRVEWLDLKTGRIEHSCVDELRFSYRSSTFKKISALVTAADFNPVPGNQADLRATMQDIAGRRRKKQPLQYPSCGSVFKRPPGSYAGMLIEQAGLKGVGFGGAEVSQKHANFIINKSRRARAEDIRRVISLCRREVYTRSGILLSPEVIFIGTFSYPLWSPPDE
ncbi:MAG: UDP-N-acetylmuramate dehydrogenase [Fibrobacterota bacterium]